MMMSSLLRVVLFISGFVRAPKMLLQGFTGFENGAFQRLRKRFEA